MKSGIAIIDSPQAGGAGFNDAAAADLLAAARALRPLLEANGPRHEKDGELSPKVVAALSEGGFWKMAVPRRWGGLCLSANAMAQVAAELAKGDPATAWVIGVMNSAVWLTSLLPDIAQREIFAKGVPRVSSVGGPPGTAVSAEGGYIVNGRWGYGSGSHHADYIYCTVTEPDGGTGPGGAFIAPASELTIDRTWNVAGMQGSGSDTIVATNLFVPTQRVYLMSRGMVGNKLPGQTCNGEVTDRWPVFPLLRSKALGVLVGIAEAVLESVTADGGARPILYTSYQRKIDSPVFRAGVGKAAAQIRAARNLMNNSTRLLDTAAIEARNATYCERGDSRGDAALAVDLLMEAVDRLMNLAGSSAFALSNKTQRYWRDFSVGSRHAVLLPEMGYEVAGGVLLGLDPDKGPVMADFI